MERMTDNNNDNLTNIIYITYPIIIFITTWILSTWYYGFLTVILGLLIPSAIGAIIKGLGLKLGFRINNYPLLWILFICYFVLLVGYLQQ